MNEELIKRIDKLIKIIESGDTLLNGTTWEILYDCRAALTKKYVPMTDGELMQIDISTGMHDPKEAWAYERNIEAEVIRRAGIEVQE